MKDQRGLCGARVTGTQLCDMMANHEGDHAQPQDYWTRLTAEARRFGFRREQAA